MDILTTIALCFAVFVLLSLYLASFKNFIKVPDNSKNTFLLRFLFIFFPVAFFSVLPTALIYGFLYILFRPVHYEYIAIASSMLSSLLVFAYFYFACIPKDNSAKRKSEYRKTGFFVYCPYSFPISSRTYGTKYIYNKNRNTNEPLIGKLSGELILDINDLKKMNPNGNILGILTGETIISKNAYHTLSGLTGINIIPIIQKGSREVSKEYFALESTHIMDPLNSQTQIKTSKFVYFEISVKNDEFFYNSNSLNKALDFNYTFEYFGTDYRGNSLRRYWILSSRAVNIMIGQLGLKQRDFIPVYFADELEISDNKTAEP